MSSGRLILGATPLGCPDDASTRLVAALRGADVVAAEDTRRLRMLAKSLDLHIAGKMVSLFDANEAARVPALIADIDAGATVLVVSDAGMPLVSDPGYRLVAACVDAGHPVTCLPGPSAVTTALAVSGLACDRFCFDGFAPRKPAARRSWLSSLSTEARTTVFFESPRRLAACLADAAELLGADRRAVVCRELTKRHEEIRRGSLGKLAEWASGGVLGEITVVLAGRGAGSAADPTALVAAVERLVAAEGLGVKEACARVATMQPGGVSRRELYEAVLRGRE